MSYPTISQLINSFFLNVYSYWAQNFLHPGAVMRKISSIFRNYLWACTVTGDKSGNVKWNDMCRIRRMVGLVSETLLHGIKLLLESLYGIQVVRNMTYG